MTTIVENFDNDLGQRYKYTRDYTAIFIDNNLLNKFNQFNCFLPTISNA